MEEGGRGEEGGAYSKRCFVGWLTSLATTSTRWKLVMMFGVTSPLHESRLLWIHDPHVKQPPRVTPRQTVITEKHDPVPRNIPQTMPRNNQTVPRNNPVTQSSDARARAPLENIQSSSWYNSNLSRDMTSRSSVCNPVPRNNVQKNNEVREETVSLPPKRKRDHKHRRERRARERERKEMRYLIMKRAWPVSAQETHPVPAFQHK